MKNILVLIFAMILISSIGVILLVLFFIPQRNSSQDNPPNQIIEENNTIEGDEQQVEGTSNIVEINIENYTYSPSTITVKKGDTVTWTNQDTVQHDVSGEGDFNGPLLSRGESFSYTFNEIGTFNYICTPHPYMTGTVIVVE